MRCQLYQQKAKERNVSEKAQRSDNQSWTQIDPRITRVARTPTVQTNFPNVRMKNRPGNVYMDSILGLPTGMPTSVPSRLDSIPGVPTRTPTRTRTPTSVPSRLVRRQQRVDQYQRQRVN